MDDTTSLRVSLRRPVDGGFAVVATASVEWQVLLTAMVQVAPVPDAFTIVPLTYTTPAAGFAGSALLRVVRPLVGLVVVHPASRPADSLCDARQRSLVPLPQKPVPVVQEALAVAIEVCLPVCMSHDS